MDGNIPVADLMNEEDILNTSVYENSTLNATANTNNDDTNVLKVVISSAIIPILCFVGIFGNLSTIIVFHFKKQNHVSSVFIIGLAFSDLMFLVLRFIANIYTICHIFFTEAIRHVRPNSFAWFIFSKFPQKVGSVFIILIVLERFTAVWFPLQVRQVWTGKRSLYTSIVLVILTMGDLVHTIDSLMFSLNEIIPEHGEVSSDIEAFRYRQHRGQFITVWINAYRIMFDMLPLPIISIFNILIIIGIKKKSFLENSNVRSQQRKEKEMRATRMLLTISVLYVLLCSPFQVLIILTYFGIERLTDSTYSILMDTFLMLNIINSVVNFLMYGINDKSLRRSYLKIWKCQKIATVDSHSDVKTRSTRF